MTAQRIREARRGWRYRRWRRRILNGEPLCRPCRKKGFTVAARELDHVVPVTREPERFWLDEAVQPICRACHEEKSARENRKESPERAAWRRRVESL